MILIRPSIDFLWQTEHALEVIEEAGRTCYKSESCITDTSAEIFVKKILKNGHLAVVEHASMSYRVICDRGVSHEIVRHRLFSYCQESTRYCDYAGGVTFIIPPWCTFKEDTYLLKDTTLIANHEDPEKVWLFSMFNAEQDYQRLRRANQTPQQARSVLPNSLKTEIVITGNLREWMHFFKLRCAESAHPQMREVANLIREDARKRILVIFDE
jgi:thymidylate synthase (FAD)